MALPRITHALFHEPWLIRSSNHLAMQETLLAYLNGTHTPPPKADERIPTHRLDNRGEKQEIKRYQMFRDGVARIPMYGIMGRHLDAFDMMCGGCSIDHTQHVLTLAANDPKVEAILLDIDSPGGTITGTPELGALIAQARDAKPVFAYTENLACSAAQWAASQAHATIATPTADLGSIGVYCAWWDETEKNAREGRELKLFAAGKYKAAGLRPLTEEEEERMQADVERIHENFKAAVLSNRPQVPASAMEGQSINAEEAAEIGLVDVIVDGFDDALDVITR